METKRRTIKIWDPLVRSGHWLLVAAFFTAYFTEDEVLGWHVWAGYVVGAIVLIRLLWGFVGPKPARFRSFLRSPLAAIGYLRDLPTDRRKHYIGHNPAGGWMTVFLLAGLAVTVVSGLVLYAQEENAGPLAPILTASEVVQIPIAAAYADDDGQDRARERRRDRDHKAHETWEEIHEVGANATLALIIVHVLGVIASSLAHRENLLRSMITGRKTLPAGEVSADAEVM